MGNSGREMLSPTTVSLHIARPRSAVGNITRAFLEDIPQRQLLVAGINFPALACDVCQSGAQLESNEDVAEVLQTLFDIPALSTVALFVEINNVRSWIQRPVRTPRRTITL